MKRQEKSWELPKYTLKKKLNKEYESCQQMFLLSLINSHFNVILCKGSKQSLSSIPRIVKLLNDDDEVDFLNLVNQQCTALYQKDIKTNISMNTAQKRLEKNKRVFASNLLLDIALELGYSFTINTTRRTGRTIQLDRIEQVFYEGKYLYDHQDVINIGSKANNYFKEVLVDSKPYTINKKNESISTILAL